MSVEMAFIPASLSEGPPVLLTPALVAAIMVVCCTS